MIKKALAGIVAFLSVLVWFFKLKADREEERADQAEASAKLHKKINQNLDDLQTDQQKRRKQEDENLKAGTRNQLDNDW